MVGIKRKGKRLDIAVLETGAERSRERAAEMIRSGLVFVDGRLIDKPGREVAPGADIEIHGGLKYVGRGGFKLEKALRTFPINLAGRVCLDIGASTGGFTDCMLQNGASKVYAVDVGTGQLDKRLCADPRVVNFEKTDIREFPPEKLIPKPDFFSADVSFISLRLVLPHALYLLKSGGQAVCLIKPQFEAGREAVGKNGVVHDPADHRRVLVEIGDFAGKLGFSLEGIDFSPIQGQQGNIEYLLYLVLPKEDAPHTTDGGRLLKMASAAVEAAFRTFVRNKVKR